MPRAKRSQSRNTQVVRQWALLRRLEEQPTPAQQLAFDFGVTIRTVYRDLAALEEAHFPLVKDEAGRWRLSAIDVAPPRRVA